jgi:hypothetical protein
MLVTGDDDRKATKGMANATMASKALMVSKIVLQ